MRRSHSTTRVRLLMIAAGVFVLYFIYGGRSASLPTYEGGSYTYTVTMTRSPRPVLAREERSSDFAQSFNPSWIEASPGTGGRAGLLVRAQNCSTPSGHQCARCAGPGDRASVLAFSAVRPTGDGAAVTAPEFARLTKESIVFGAGQMPDSRDAYGAEDPRVVYDAATGLYHVFYTCFGYYKGTSVVLCLATARDPTRKDGGWTLRGPVFGWGAQWSKSAALLTAKSYGGSEHLLFWGAGAIRLARSANLGSWPQDWETPVWLSTIPGSSWESKGVEAGPPPLRLSTGDWLFIYNAWAGDTAADEVYRPGWVVLSGKDPSQIVQRSQEPLAAPEMPWEKGEAPYWCNVANVIFVEAAHPTEEPDVFRVYYGAGDAAVGTGLIRVGSKKL